MCADLSPDKQGAKRRIMYVLFRAALDMALSLTWERTSTITDEYMATQSLDFD